MEGKIVISDRYFYSALVNLRARGYKSDKWIYEIAQLIPKPDAAFFLNLATDDAIQRVRLRASEKDRWIDLEFEHSLNEEFIYIQSITDCISLDSGKGVHQNHFDVVRRVNKVLAEKQP
jgi:thymidylate kinase